MSAADRPLAGLLEKINLLFIPVVNVDGDLRRSAYGRINQNGPQETGWRVNGRNLNLNRDFTKLDSAEIRNVAWVFNHYELSFFADTHSTDGAMYPTTAPTATTATAGHRRAAPGWTRSCASRCTRRWKASGTWSMNASA